MSQVLVPDIGDFKEVEVIEVLVKPGDAVAKEQSLITLESDKATMEIPSPSAGVVKELKIKMGDKVSKGSPILELDAKDDAARAEAPKKEVAKPQETKAPATGDATTVPVPDIGDFKEVEVIEVLVKPGDSVAKEQSLITLESDKATMEIPSPTAGVVKELRIKVGDKVSKGAPILVLAGGSSPSSSARAKGPSCCTRAGREADSKRAAGGNRQQAARKPVGAQVCARARRRSHAGPGQRAEGPHPPYRRAGFREGSACKSAGSRGRQRRRRGTSLQPAAVAGSRLRQVRSGRNQAAVAHPEAVGALPAPQLDLDPARHAVRRGRHHRARGVPQGADGRDREAGLQAHDAGLHDQGLRHRAAAVPGVQLVARQVGRKHRHQEVLSHRRGGRHARRAGGAGGARCGPQGRVRPRARAGRHLQAGARRQAQARRHAGRDLLDLEPGRHRRHRFHADHQRARGGDPGRLAVRIPSRICREGREGQRQL